MAVGQAAEVAAGQIADLIAVLERHQAAVVATAAHAGTRDPREVAVEAFPNDPRLDTFTLGADVIGRVLELMRSNGGVLSAQPNDIAEARAILDGQRPQVLAALRRRL